MRPRHKAAEYLDTLDKRCFDLVASMRPRHKAAEYGHRDRGDGAAGGASMRPRHKAAEYDERRGPESLAPKRFNEAAA